jgi:hypothetical protein
MAHTSGSFSNTSFTKKRMVLSLKWKWKVRLRERERRLPTKRSDQLNETKSRLSIKTKQKKAVGGTTSILSNLISQKCMGNSEINLI